MDDSGEAGCGRIWRSLELRRNADLADAGGRSRDIGTPSVRRDRALNDIGERADGGRDARQPDGNHSRHPWMDKTEIGEDTWIGKDHAVALSRLEIPPVEKSADLKTGGPQGIIQSRFRLGEQDARQRMSSGGQVGPLHGIAD